MIDEDLIELNRKNQISRIESSGLFRSLNPEKITYYRISESALSELLLNKVGISYSFVTFHTKTSEEYLSVDGNLNETDIKLISKMQSGQYVFNASHILINYLCDQEYIPEGNYLIVP